MEPHRWWPVTHSARGRQPDAARTLSPSTRGQDGYAIADTLAGYPELETFMIAGYDSAVVTAFEVARHATQIPAAP